MRVGVNARALTKPEPAGVSRYTRELLCALAETRPDLEYVLFGVESVPGPLSGHDHVHGAGVPAPAPGGPRAHYWEQAVLPRAIARHDLDVFHTPAGQPPLLARVPLVTTIHDVSPVRHPEWFSRGYATLVRVLTPLAVRRSTRVLTVSAFSRDELAAAYPAAADKTVAVHNGVRPPSAPGSPVDGLRDEEFLLFVGGANPRKNVGTLLRAYRRYRTRVDDPATLVLAGPDRDVFADDGRAEPEGVRALGFVPDEELAWLYHRAEAFVFPSLYEGFGLPVVEAMGAGTPVVTSDRGATAEVAGDAARLVDPTDPAEIAAEIERLLADESLRDRLVERGRERAEAFSWERAASETAEVYRAAAEGRRREPVQR